jgi:hypothetical protein
MILLRRGGTSLSQREREAAKRPGEGQQSLSLASPLALYHAKRLNRTRPQPLTRRLRRHPLPRGEGLARSLVAWKWVSWVASPRDVGCSSYFLDDPIESFLHFIIGETNFQEPMRLDQRAPCHIVLDLIKMMLAIDFDRKTEVIAAEVGDEARNWRLPSEFQTIKPAPAKLPPKQVFGRRALPTKMPRDVGQMVRHPIRFATDRQRTQSRTPRLRGHAFPIGGGT